MILNGEGSLRSRSGSFHAGGNGTHVSGNAALKARAAYEQTRHISLATIVTELMHSMDGLECIQPGCCNASDAENNESCCRTADT